MFNRAMPIAQSGTTRELAISVTDLRGSDVAPLDSGANLSRQIVFLIAILFATKLVSSAQSIPGATPRGSLSVPLPTARTLRVQTPPAPFTHLKPPLLEAPYRPLRTREYLRWFAANTMDPSNQAVGMLGATLGTAVNRPREYRPHWGGFARRDGIGVSGKVAGNVIEAGAGLILREDPRYFRVPDQPFGTRVRNVVRLTFSARRVNGGFKPAYARYVAIVGTNFISNSWRVNSEANTPHAVLRSAEGFCALLAGNAVAEFWPDVKEHLFRRRN